MPREGKNPNRIKLIKDYRKIAAGEVITRPADCVKELLENSIDASSTQITINIKDFGKELIQIIDNGCGIEKDDVEFAFKPHYSSKLDTIEDLNKLNTLGFRGEALASISAISKIELITKTKNSNMGVKCVLEEGTTKSIESIGAPIGTNIKIRDLFYNTPVRRKFLKSDRVEMGHITDIITRLILVYPEIHFKLIHNDIPLINSPSAKKQINVIFDIYGKNITKNLFEFSHDDSLFKIRGWLGDPSLSRSTSITSSVFVNKRYITSKLITDVIKEAYKDYLMIKRNPFFIVFFEFSPEKIDVNIHPTKKVIRFDNESLFGKRLLHVLSVIVEKKFGRNKKIESIETTKEKFLFKPVLQEFEQELSNSVKNENLEVNKKAQDGIRPENFNIERRNIKSIQKIDKWYNKLGNKSGKVYYSDRSRIITTGVFPDMKLINEVGQLDKTYIVLEGGEGFFLLDQHAAAERIKYEEQTEMYNKGGLQRQNLILPIKFDITINQKHFFEETLPELSKFGFDIDSLGGTTYAIRSIPVILKKLKNSDIIKDICLEIISFGRQSTLDNIVEKVIKYIACHKSLRGGEELNKQEKVKHLIQRLSKCKNPHHCAHGRPTILFISYKEIEKLFHRIQ